MTDWRNPKSCLGMEISFDLHFGFAHSIRVYLQTLTKQEKLNWNLINERINKNLRFAFELPPRRIWKRRRGHPIYLLFCV